MLKVRPCVIKLIGNIKAPKQNWCQWVFNTWLNTSSAPAQVKEWSQVFKLFFFGTKMQVCQNIEYQHHVLLSSTTPDICQFWYATALFRIIKVHQICDEIANICQNWPTFCVLYATKYIGKKKLHHHRCWRCWLIPAMSSTVLCKIYTGWLLGIFRVWCLD